MVEIAEVGKAIQRVFFGRAIFAGENPTVRPEIMVEDDEFDNVLKAFEAAGDICPVRERAAEAQIEIIPSFLGGEFRAWVA